MEISVKNNVDTLIFHTAICVAGTTNSIYRRAKSEIWLAIPPARCACGMEISMEKIKGNTELVKKKYTTMTIVTRREKLRALQETLIELNIPGMTTTMVEGNGQQLGEISYMQNGLKKAKLIPKVMVEVNYCDMDTELIINTICEKLRTNIMGDGKIFITENEGYIVRIRTTE